ncbi:hypothetical protein BMF94_0138 [Rhodotorula taiwanensis]|uniref:F-box domain-containing protein n=1 Tax=Rhodotorula taiwanensis TaxID=741276 RepID=A0A2S5BJE3_9BASI|nr:hypothetical protein BMF94_0138 [Rhodotorula taiwanensis]
MDALPDELVDYALSFLSLDRDGLDLDSLKHASLVHSRWTHAAQRYIWQAGAELLTPDDVDQFIKTAPRRTSGPRELAVHAHASMHQLTRLWDVCGDGDLKMLMIATPTRDVDPAVLVHPALKGLKQLILQGWFVRKESPSELDYPFRNLESLVAVDLSPSRRSPLDQFLTSLAPRCIPALESISLPAIPSHASEAVARSLVPFAPHLKHLGVSLNDRTTERHFIPVLEAAMRLHSFECTTLPYSLLGSMPPSLAVLATMEDAEQLDPPKLRDVLFAQCPRLERLFFACTRAEFEARPEGGDVLRIARGKGIDWRFGGELDE